MPFLWGGVNSAARDTLGLGLTLFADGVTACRALPDGPNLSWHDTFRGGGESVEEQLLSPSSESSGSACSSRSGLLIWTYNT